MTQQNRKETKEEKFLRMSKERIDKVEKAIDHLENLSNKASYSYTDQQVDKMFDYLTEKLENAKKKFKHGHNIGDFSWDK